METTIQHHPVYFQIKIAPYKKTVLLYNLCIVILEITPKI